MTSGRPERFLSTPSEMSDMRQRVYSRRRFTLHTVYITAYCIGWKGEPVTKKKRLQFQSIDWNGRFDDLRPGCDNHTHRMRGVTGFEMFWKKCASVLYVSQSLHSPYLQPYLKQLEWKLAPPSLRSCFNSRKWWIAPSKLGGFTALSTGVFPRVSVGHLVRHRQHTSHGAKPLWWSCQMHT